MNKYPIQAVREETEKITQEVKRKLEMHELDTTATERVGNTNNWFIKKKRNNGCIVNF